MLTMAMLDRQVLHPERVRPLLRVAGIGPEPASAADAWSRIESFFATYLH